METAKKPRMHYVADAIINPPHKLTVNIIGAGGTGSNVVSNIAAMNKSLIALGHPGLQVTLFDDDRVTEANTARQLFYESDLGQYKAEVLIGRINRAFGTKWISVCQRYNMKYAKRSWDAEFKANITITCVDSVKSRKEIAQVLQADQYRTYDHNHAWYWMDCGNGNKFGQIYIGTIGTIIQPKSSKYKPVSSIQTPDKYFKNQIDSKDDGPSFSLAEALGKQDLYINKTIATYCCNILWNMFREAKLPYSGIYINLERYLTNPISI